MRPNSVALDSVLFLQMPYAALPRPSLGLGLLQSSLNRQQIPSRILYGNLLWAESIGLDELILVTNRAEHHLVGEWTFARAAFREQAPDAQELLEAMPYSHFHRQAQGVSQRLLRIREELAPPFIDRLARQCLERGARVIGCSSTFEQHVASLALLRRVRELDPSVVTLMGGANCEGEMGAATLAAFPWIDLVVSGEADELIVALIQELLEKGRDFRPAKLPHGVMVSGHSGPAPRATVRQLDQLPHPCFDDYFEHLSASPLLGETIRPALPLESSRGCWWGARHHCTFCGLNGHGMGYRSKSPERLLTEMDELSQRYQVTRLNMVDNILDMSYFQSLLPRLEERSYRLFFETKANLKLAQLEQLKRAGVDFIQPGIETLDDHILKLFDKGTTALINVQLLRRARQVGIQLVWLFLFNVPGELDQWYWQMSEWLPWIFHLQPPNLITKVRYDRFSPYHNRPQDYGLHPSPNANYARVYPLAPAQLEGLAYFFEDDPGQALPPGREPEGDPSRPGRDRLAGQIRAWMEAFNYSQIPPVLSMRDRGKDLFIVDTRPGSTERFYCLTGAAREVLLHCDQPRVLSEVPPELIQRRLLLAQAGKYLSLPVTGDQPSLPGMSQMPGGSVAYVPDWMRQPAGRT